MIDCKVSPVYNDIVFKELLGENEMGLNKKK